MGRIDRKGAMVRNGHGEIFPFFGSTGAYDLSRLHIVPVAIATNDESTVLVDLQRRGISSCRSHVVPRHPLMLFVKEAFVSYSSSTAATHHWSLRGPDSHRARNL